MKRIKDFCTIARNTYFFQCILNWQNGSARGLLVIEKGCAITLNGSDLSIMAPRSVADKEHVNRTFVFRFSSEKDAIVWLGYLNTILRPTLPPYILANSSLPQTKDENMFHKDIRSLMNKSDGLWSAMKDHGAGVYSLPLLSTEFCGTLLDELIKFCTHWKYHLVSSP